MSERDRDRERPKKSWREIDAQRDRAGGRAPSEIDRVKQGHADARSSKQYRAALDALFEKGEVGKLAEKLSPPPTSTRASEPPPEPARTVEAPKAAAPAKSEDGRAPLRKKVLEALGRDEITRAVDRY